MLAENRSNFPVVWWMLALISIVSFIIFAYLNNFWRGQNNTLGDENFASKNGKICQISSGRCALNLATIGDFVITVNPFPVNSLQPVNISIYASEGIDSVKFFLSGEDMFMGDFPLNTQAELIKPHSQANHPDNSAQLRKKFSATTVLPICTRKEMLWRLRSEIKDIQGKFYRVPVLFTSSAASK